jgi:hypothetical protein
MLPIDDNFGKFTDVRPVQLKNAPERISVTTGAYTLAIAWHPANAFSHILSAFGNDAESSEEHPANA